MVRLYTQAIRFSANKQWIAVVLVLLSLFFSTAANAQEIETLTTETLDWFADDVDQQIPNDAVFTIKDVQTGMTFTAIRCSGKSHLDAEPASAADTAAFKEIVGGKWRWLGRPILIMYDSRVFAASMCSKPHGTQTIKDNDYDGHFCIHFKNSRTHAQDKVIRSYQNAVAIAGESSWHEAP